jgi:hypothetical protein
MNVKHLILPATLSYAGVRASALLGTTNTFLQIAAGIAGAALGLAIAKHV